MTLVSRGATRRAPVRRRRRYRRNRRYKKSYALTALRTSRYLSKPSYGVPTEYFTKLVYATSFVLANNTASFVTKTWRANALFDPESSGGTHKPAQFVEIAALYRNYRVYAFKLELTAFCKDATNEAFMIGYRTRHSGNSPPANLIQLRESTNQRQQHIMINSLQPVGRLRSPVIYCNRIEGISKEAYRTEAYDSLVTANPINRPKIDIFSATIDNSTATIANEFQLRIVYYCKFFNPIQNNDPAT